jgi:hypothetical protein
MGLSYKIVPRKREINMTKTFYITYWASKHKKHITRQGKHDEKSRYGVAKNGTPYYVYYDLDAHGYRTATTSWKVRH